MSDDYKVVEIDDGLSEKEINSLVGRINGKYGKVSIIFFNNGNTAVFNEEGKQINKLQRSWVEVFIEFLESKGVSGIDAANSFIPSGSSSTQYNTQI